MAAGDANRAAIRIRIAFSVAAGPLVCVLHLMLYELVLLTPYLVELLTQYESLPGFFYVEWPFAALRVSGPAGLYLVLALIWRRVILWSPAKRWAIAATASVFVVHCLMALYLDTTSYQARPLLWVLAAVLAYATLTWCYYQSPSPAGSGEAACPSCGNDLRGQRECRCPECGREFTLAELAGRT